MNLHEKVILVDCDGVLLDWEYSFREWMISHGHTLVDPTVYDQGKAWGITKARARELIAEFNDSAAIGWLTPFRDAIKYVRMLHEEHGFVFHCITSLSLDPYAGKLREKNLHAVFGETVFEKIICLDTGADKDEALLPYAGSGCFWVEDKPENAEVGLKLGLCAVLIEHGHNKDYDHDGIIKVKSWKEIYETIV